MIDPHNPNKSKKVSNMGKKNKHNRHHKNKCNKNPIAFNENLFICTIMTALFVTGYSLYNCYSPISIALFGIFSCIIAGVSTSFIDKS